MPPAHCSLLPPSASTPPPASIPKTLKLAPPPMPTADVAPRNTGPGGAARVPKWASDS